MIPSSLLKNIIRPFTDNRPFARQAYAFGKAVSIFALAFNAAHTTARGSDSAPTPNEDTLYKIELLVFADARRSYQQNEAWPDIEALAYPEHLVFIYHPDEKKRIIDSLNTTILEKRYRVAELNPAQLSESDNDIPLDTDQTLDSYPLNSDSLPNDSIVAEENGEEDNDTIIPLPALMEILPLEEMELGTIAKTLQRRSAYQLLYKNAWYQSLTDRQRAPSIPIQGGQAFDGRYQLEGSVKFSKGRFLHITTDLWLIDWEYSRRRKEATPWYLRRNTKLEIPDLPVRSSFAEALALEQQIEALDREIDALESNRGLAPYSRSTTTTKRLNDAEINSAVSTATNEYGHTATSDAEFLTKQASMFSPTQIYTLREYRRVKRDEVHYLDHPLFGVVAMISKYSTE